MVTQIKSANRHFQLLLKTDLIIQEIYEAYQVNCSTALIYPVILKRF